MIPARPAPQHLHGLPTLTEVIELPPRQPPPGVAGQETPPAPQRDGESGASGLAALLPAEFNEQRLVQAVLNELQRHADLMLEQRLREAMAPALARLADKLVDELRQELAATLRDLVARAVSQEAARLRGR